MVINDYPEIRIMYVKSDSGVRGSEQAFDKLEAKLPSLRGRKFYGVIFGTPPDDEYWACVELQKSDTPQQWGYQTGTIPGGAYAQQTLDNWEDNIRSIGETFKKLSGLVDADTSRPSIEFYRSMRDMRIRIPVKNHPGK